MMLALATILLSAVTVAPADVTGKWEGPLTATRSDGSTHQDTVLLILTQKGGTKSVGARPISMRSVRARSTATRWSSWPGTPRTGASTGSSSKLQDEELNGTVTVGEWRAEVRTKRRKE